MSDDIIFIKDENDYAEYSKLRPKRKYCNKKVKYICRQCNNTITSRFKSLTENFICPHCRMSNTKKSKYKVLDFTYINNEEELMYYKSLRPQAPYLYRKIKFRCTKCNRIKSRNFISFDINNSPFICNECKLKQTCGTPEYKNRLKAIMVEKYGVDNIQKSKEYRRKRDKTEQRYLVEKYDKLIPEHVLDYDYHYYTCYCPVCDNTFKIEKDLFYTRIINHGTTVCIFCHPISNCGSGKQVQLKNYISEIYKENIVYNDKVMLNGKEIDLYLPELRLGFEFDGMYWHADPRFYKEDTIIEHKHVTAREIWQRDKEKDILCESKGIKLIRIKEYDWVNFNEKEKVRIKDVIENRKKDLSLQNN